jgi:hypothetical protein
VPTVAQVPEPRPAEFIISSLTITPGEVTTGSSVTIEVLVTNTGDLSSAYDVTLNIDNAVEATEKVTLAGGASHKVAFKVTRFTARTYSVNIGGQSGSFIVQPSSFPSTPPAPTQTKPLPSLDAFMKGFSFADWNSSLKERPPLVGPLFYPLYADQAMKNLSATGTNWVNLVVQVFQESITSTNVIRDKYGTASDSALQHMVDLAHSLGMRISLMPMILIPTDPSHFAGHIGTAFTNETQWQDWFASYRETINHYATFAQNSGVDMFVIGHELGATTHRNDDWRRIIQEVRQQFKGPITYSSLASTTSFPHGEEKRITWWDAVDYIGIQAYYKLTTKNDPTVKELKAAWVYNGHIALLEDLSRRFNKPIIFTELGYVSKDGANKVPAYFQLEAPLDLQEQADCYQAALEVLWGKPWLKGIFFWQWLANPVWWPGGLNDKGEFPYGKPAEEVVKKFYLSK